MEKNVVLFLAQGFEEVEAVTPVDYLRRAGVAVHIAAVGEDLLVTGARGISVQADSTLEDLKKEGRLVPSGWDGVLIPGGMPGASNIAASGDACGFIKDMAAKGKLVSAICASPAVVLAPLGILQGRRFTCFPGMEGSVTGAQWSEDRVVTDGTIVTSRGPGTAAEWAVTMAEILAGPDKAAAVVSATLVRV
ncbi:DJ-1 family glyoxalase III [Breznakiella homolactica]|uniref:DJ-1/PfpI family protein n=1 Tax=Breznakiella homolactica TaxID=2798577 RepID=A0A7T8B9X3_9SPIR|nr:DJ-1 family glyoxalase III [Breznakiella homolactica]QQO08942.1 DJ-1/PfpI family protein [Breznakiella homolactica]